MTQRQIIPFDNISPYSCESLYSYAHLIFSRFNEARGFMMTEDQILNKVPEILDNARKWVRYVESNIDNLDGVYRPELISVFDIIHRIARFRPANPKLLASWV